MAILTGKGATSQRSVVGTIRRYPERESKTNPGKMLAPMNMICVQLDARDSKNDLSGGAYLYTKEYPDANTPETSRKTHWQNVSAKQVETLLNSIGDDCQRGVKGKKGEIFDTIEFAAVTDLQGPKEGKGFMPTFEKEGSIKPSPLKIDSKTMKEQAAKAKEAYAAGKAAYEARMAEKAAKAAEGKAARESMTAEAETQTEAAVAAPEMDEDVSFAD